ncbi:hypothetical protein PVAP13_3KG547150 [Panicum virgatum]|uniref:Uncharacterized protein n=1 Tax=Panicum virgatum TaxID=38727 RepID=A0A8T0V6B9_PANVG|nr:hypothetical protein PVAP13_3KG547150 [Panicum virgatum]
MSCRQGRHGRGIEKAREPASGCCGGDREAETTFAIGGDPARHGGRPAGQVRRIIVRRRPPRLAGLNKGEPQSEPAWLPRGGQGALVHLPLAARRDTCRHLNQAPYSADWWPLPTPSTRSGSARFHGPYRGHSASRPSLDRKAQLLKHTGTAHLSFPHNPPTHRSLRALSLSPPPRRRLARARSRR